MTYFKDGWGGTHNFKVGGEMLFEYGWYGYTQVASGNQRTTIATSGAPSSFAFYAPTALKVGSLGDGPSGNLLSIDRVNTKDLFFTDQFSFGRATLNLGVRYDGYDVFTPDQTQLAYNFPTGVSIPAASCATSPAFCKTDYVKWNSIVPRLGMSYDLMGTGKTVLKANYGMYRFNPGVGVASSANPNQQVKSITYSSKVAGAADTVYYTDPTTGTKYTANAITSSALAGAISVDPNIKQPYVAPGDGLHRAAVDRRRRPAGRFRLLLGQEPDRHGWLPAQSSGVCLHRAVQRRRSGPGRHRRQRGRSVADRLRHPELAAHRLHRDADDAERQPARIRRTR